MIKKDENSWILPRRNIHTKMRKSVFCDLNHSVTNKSPLFSTFLKVAEKKFWFQYIRLQLTKNDGRKFQKARFWNLFVRNTYRETPTLQRKIRLWWKADVDWKYTKLMSLDKSVPCKINIELRDFFQTSKGALFSTLNHKKAHRNIFASNQTESNFLFMFFPLLWQTKCFLWIFLQYKELKIDRNCAKKLSFHNLLAKWKLFRKLRQHNQNRISNNLEICCFDC